jgi:uncharacterized membrane protein
MTYQYIFNQILIFLAVIGFVFSTQIIQFIANYYFGQVGSIIATAIIIYLTLLLTQKYDFKKTTKGKRD